MVKKAISKAIKSQNWLAIEYLNKNDEITNYWIAINDIDIESKTFSVNTFNHALMTKDNDSVLNTHIKFEQIKSAVPLTNTKYDQPVNLINKIESNLIKLLVLDMISKVCSLGDKY